MALIDSKKPLVDSTVRLSDSLGRLTDSMERCNNLPIIFGSMFVNMFGGIGSIYYGTLGLMDSNIPSMQTGDGGELSDDEGRLDDGYISSPRH